MNSDEELLATAKQIQTLERNFIAEGLGDPNSAYQSKITTTQNESKILSPINTNKNLKAQRATASPKKSDDAPTQQPIQVHNLPVIRDQAGNGLVTASLGNEISKAKDLRMPQINL